jgi:hypothetical protein
MGRKSREKKERREGRGNVLINALTSMLDRRLAEAANNTGSSQTDYLYAKAQNPRWLEGSTTHATVYFRGEQYGPLPITWGPLDRDKRKDTVLIQATDDGKWYKLWFWSHKIR